MNDYIVLVTRLLLAQIFILSGLTKLGSYAATQGYMESMGVPSLLLPLVIALEIGGGLSLVVGWLARWSALALAGFCIAAAVLFHWNFADQMQAINFMKNLAMTGGLLLLYVHGAGRLSMDARRI
ncbi:MAG: DoxX family protein [Nitrososphaera sp.]|uniref:DoxX family protein n=1 Tax=Nitrososphaera sp. TaxID=1971748 RepID=UPI003D6E3266